MAQVGYKFHLRRQFPIDYLMLACFSATFSLMNMWIASIFEFRQVLFFMLNLACMMTCLLIFCLVTRINIKAQPFTLAILVMSSANFIIFLKGGKQPFNDTLYTSIFTFAYATHYINRLQQMVEGDRLDVNTQDWIYGGIINYMDVPYFVVGFFNYFLPLTSWLGLNFDPDRDDRLSGKAGSAQTTKAKSTGTANKKNK